MFGPPKKTKCLDTFTFISLPSSISISRHQKPTQKRITWVLTCSGLFPLGSNGFIGCEKWDGLCLAPMWPRAAGCFQNDTHCLLNDQHHTMPKTLSQNGLVSAVFALLSPLFLDAPHSLVFPVGPMYGIFTYIHHKKQPFM